VLPVSLFGKLANGEITLEDWLFEAKRMGLEYADFSMMLFRDHTPKYLNGIRAMIEDAGISIAMASTYPDFTHPDAIQRERELGYLHGDIAVCSALGIQYLRVLAGQAHPETGREDGIRWATELLRRGAVLAELLGVTLVYENHYKPGVWNYVDFSFPLDIFMEIRQNLKGSGVRINFDTGNVSAYGGDPLAILEELYEDVATIHISDMGELGVFSPVVIGTGITPNAEILAFLKDRGFDGLVCIEEASNTGYEGIQKAVTFVRDVGGWR